MAENIRIDYQPAKDFVDLSKPYDYNKLYYKVVAEGDAVPEKENTLYLPIKGVYFNAIISGEKTKEYREVKYTTFSKYLETEKRDLVIMRKDCPDLDIVDFNLYHNGYFPYEPKAYKYLKIAVGYETERDWAVVEVTGISFEPQLNDDGEVYRFMLDDQTDTYNPEGDGCYWIIVYHLGKVVEYHPKGEKVSEPAVKYETMGGRISGGRTSGGRTFLSDINNHGQECPCTQRNFDYLKGNPDFADLYYLCNEAEICQHSDPPKAALSCRRALEYTVKAIYLLKGFPIPERASLFELVDNEDFKSFINDETLMKNLHYIRKAGNSAAHLGNIAKDQSFFSVLNLHNFVGSVLMMLNVIDEFPRFDKKLLSPKKEIYIVPKADVQPIPAVIKKYETVAEEKPVLHVAPMPEYFTEAETRAMYIDILLQEAGWNVLKDKGIMAPNSVGIEIALGGQKGGRTFLSDINNTDRTVRAPETPTVPMAIGMSEHPKYADYVIFGKDGKPLAVVEAKKTSVDPIAGKHQAEFYAECLEAQYGVKPIIYYTNGYEIYCVDRLGYPPRRMSGFHSRENLELLIQRQDRKSITDLRVKDEITNRAYQKQAITSICEHLNKYHRRGLLVMATGTGKTRVSISLVDVLMRNDWIKNVLFLADRTSLVSQAHKNFAKLLPSATTSVLSDKDKKPDKNARILFSTYQTMVNFIDSDTKEFSVGRFDLIIIDEAHRSIFGKYMSIFNYFDAFLVGLTATPREEVDKSTYQMFQMEEGHPNFAYELDEAVADGFLNPYEVIDRQSKILSGGIKYDDLSDEEKEQMDKIFEYEQGVLDSPELQNFGRRDILPSEIYKYLFNIDTVDKVLRDLMKNGLKIHGGEIIGKTIIFAYNHLHAVLIVKRFNLLFPQYGSEFCMLIDNTVNYSQDLINRFEVRDKEPQIAVSVDMLDTGIDVPDILNLVFFKVVKSKIKFQQMIGRGTRLSENIFGEGENKKNFLIFDFCNNFEYFSLNFKQAKQVRQLSLTEKLFNLKLEIAVALQALSYQEDEYLKSFHDRLKAESRSRIETLSRNRIDVRNEWQLVDKYSTEKAWEYVSPVDSLDIQNHISPLLQPTLEDENAKRFDLLTLWIELSLVDKEIDASSTINQVVKIAEILSEKMSITQVQKKKAVIQEVQTEKFWDNVSVSALERVRMELRDLMRFLTGTEKKKFEIDIEDEFTDNGEAAKPKFPMSYKQRVLDYLSENSDNPVIKKIKNLEQLTFHDVNKLEKALWEELGTKGEYEKYTKNMLCGGNVAVFIRSLVGIDRETALKKFSQFLDANTLNSDQQEYLKSILDYVSVNGDISGDIITKTEPFNEFDWFKVYGEKVAFVGKYVNELHQVVITA